MEELLGDLNRVSALADDDQLPAAVAAARTLTVYRGVLEDRVGRAMISLLEALGAAEGASLAPASRLYAEVFTLLAEEVELSSVPVVGDAWQNHLLERILLDENPFSRKAQLAPLADMGPALVEAARGDLAHLRLLFELDSTLLRERLEARPAYRSSCVWPLWSGLCPMNGTGSSADNHARIALKSLLLTSQDWREYLPVLASHYARHGTGLFGCHRAFRWAPMDGRGALVGVRHPDPVRLSDLIGYERERALLLVNTEHFLAGYPANNVLLCGDRGTGKSSTIKALLTQYGDQGLRLVEVSKQHLSDLPAILDHLGGSRQRFVLYVDDLSFDEHETDYKSLKAVLEGGLESKPDNVLLYATSNRRHLVRERFGDRDEAVPDEIHTRDTVEEKLSLSDRFGITLVFMAPDQSRYLAICQALAERQGLNISHENLCRRALQWSTGQKGFSGRTAKQFIDHLAADLALHPNAADASAD